MSFPDFKIDGTKQRALAAATLGFFFGAMAISLFGPTARALADSMGLSPLEVGLLVAVPSLSGSLLRIPFGASVDVNGGSKPFKFLMICAVLGLIGLSVLFTLAYPNGLKGLYGLLLALGCLAGCGIATFSVGATQISYWYPKKEQGFALGLFGGFATTSAGLMAIALPLLLSTFGLVGAYYVITAVMVLGAVLYASLCANAPYFQYRDQGSSDAQARQKAAAHEQELFPTGNIVASLKTSASIPQTWYLVGTYFTTFGGFMALTAWFPTYWREVHQLGALHAGVLTALFSIVAALMRIPGGKVADRVGGVATSMGGLLVTAIAAGLMVLDVNWMTQFVFTIVLAIAMGFNNAAAMKLIPVYIPQAVGGASGWIGGLGAFGGFVLPPVLGAIVALYPGNGFGLGFLVFTVLSLANMLVNYLGMIRPARAGNVAKAH